MADSWRRDRVTRGALSPAERTPRGVALLRDRRARRVARGQEPQRALGVLERRGRVAARQPRQAALVEGEPLAGRYLDGAREVALGAVELAQLPVRDAAVEDRRPGARVDLERA